MEAKDRISILLVEYNTLRAEVLSARENVAKAISIGTPFFLSFGGLFFTFASYKCVTGAAAFAVLVGVVAIAVWNDQNTRSFTRRIRTIEKTVNTLAEGERLLVWETDYGWGSIFPPKSNPDFKGW